MVYGAWMITTSCPSCGVQPSFVVSPPRIQQVSCFDYDLPGHKYIRPKSIHDPEVVEEYSKHYIYFACIEFINSVRPHLLESSI